MIESNVKKLLEEIPATNPFGEKVTLVAAVKTQSAESINRAVRAGITDIGDNHAQEFKDKFNDICGHPVRHFIGHLQTNKIKYLLGKVDLYHSVDRLSLARELSAKSVRANVTSDILLQINIGREESKGGFDPDGAESAYAAVKQLPNLKTAGLMAMLPDTDDKGELKRLALQMRAIFDKLKSADGNITYLSMGMSGDWKLCIECGSNMVRLGTAIFGERNYSKT